MGQPGRCAMGEPRSNPDMAAILSWLQCNNANRTALFCFDVAVNPGLWNC